MVVLVAALALSISAGVRGLYLLQAGTAFAHVLTQLYQTNKRSSLFERATVHYTLTLVAQRPRPRW